MKILHLVICLDMGGQEIMICSLANQQHKNGHAICLGVLEYPGTLADRVEPLATWIGDQAHRGRRAALFSLVRFVRKHRIEMIHSHGPQPHFYAVMAHLLTGVPVVHTKHGRDYPDMPRRVLLNRVLSWFTRKIVAVSEDVAALARTHERVNPRKVAVVRNGVDCTRYTQTAAPRSTRSSLTIGSVGRLSAAKNYALLLQAFAAISIPEARMLLVGDGPERGKLERLADELGIAGRVAFVGQQADPRPFYGQMDVFCLSSDTEGTPLTLLEAGACGLPSAVTDAGGNAEVVRDGVTGLVVPKADTAALATALERLCGDAALRQQMGRAARQRIVAHYSVKAMVAGYEQVLRAIHTQ